MVDFKQLAEQYKEELLDRGTSFLVGTFTRCRVRRILHLLEPRWICVRYR